MGDARGRHPADPGHVPAERACPRRYSRPATTVFAPSSSKDANPLRSWADTKKFEEAFKALDLLVVIDPAMSEAARLAHYVLPAKVGYEKFEASLFPEGVP